MTTGEFRCENPLCHKLLFKIKDLTLDKGSIEIKCRCKQMNILTASALTPSRIRP